MTKSSLEESPAAPACCSAALVDGLMWVATLDITGKSLKGRRPLDPVSKVVPELVADNQTEPAIWLVAGLGEYRDDRLSQLVRVLEFALAVGGLFVRARDDHNHQRSAFHGLGHRLDEVALQIFNVDPYAIVSSLQAPRKEESHVLMAPVIRYHYPVLPSWTSIARVCRRAAGRRLGQRGLPPGPLFFWCGGSNIAVAPALEQGAVDALDEVLVPGVPEIDLRQLKPLGEMKFTFQALAQSGRGSKAPEGVDGPGLLPLVARVAPLEEAEKRSSQSNPGSAIVTDHHQSTRLVCHDHGNAVDKI